MTEPGWAMQRELIDRRRPAVVLIHALGLDASMWNEVAPYLGDRRVVSIELPGHGRSPHDNRQVTVEQLGAWILGELDAQDVGSFDVVGVSLGGHVALWLGLSTSRVRSVVACNTAARVGTPGFWQERIDAVRSVGLPGMVDAVVSRFFATGFGDRNPDLVDGVKARFVATEPDSYIACCRVLQSSDLTGALLALRQPCLVAGGTDDVATPVGESVRLADAIPDGELLTMDGVGHLIPLEAPEAFGERVAQFLDYVDRLP